MPVMKGHNQLDVKYLVPRYSLRKQSVYSTQAWITNGAKQCNVRVLQCGIYIEHYENEVDLKVLLNKTDKMNYWQLLSNDLLLRSDHLKI